MEVNIKSTPDMKNPTLIAAWPGMGLLGKISADYLAEKLGGEEFAEIETYRNDIKYEDGVAEYSPVKHKFYAVPNSNIIICAGDAQPNQASEVHRVASEVLDIGEKVGVDKVITLAAYLTPGQDDSKIFGVVSGKELADAVEEYGVDVAEGEGRITGLNGVLVGIAKKRGLESMCLMGQIGYAEIPQPGSAKGVVEVISQMLDVELDLSGLEQQQQEIDESIKQRIDSVKERFKGEEPGELRYIG